MKLKRLLLITPFLLTSCSNLHIKKPEDTNLTFWITQEVSYDEMKESGCTVIPGWFGATEYLDGKYQKDENEYQSIPKVHVTYLVQSYPDASSGNSTITRIEITDPEITVYGLTINSSEEEVEERMKKVSGASKKENCYQIKKASFAFSEERIYISVPVTNRFHLIF